MNDPGADTSRAVTIATAPNEVVARMWQEVLSDEGIVAALKPAGAGHSFATSALIEHYVLVLEEHAQRARTIIEDFESDPGEEGTDDSSNASGA